MRDRTQRRKNIAFYIVSYISLMATVAGMFYAYFVYLWEGSWESLTLGISLSVLFVLLLVLMIFIFSYYSKRMLREAMITRQISSLSDQELREQIKSNTISSIISLIFGFLILSYVVGIYLMYHSVYGFVKRRMMVVELSKRKKKIEPPKNRGSNELKTTQKF